MLIDDDLRLTDAERKFIESLPGHELGNFLDFQDQPQANSCDWIPSNDNFLEFLSSSHNHVFHIVGEPGSGKSTAAAWLFRTGRSWNPGRQLLLFSFHGKSRASAAWGSLLFQLLRLEGTSVDVIHGALEDEEQSSRWKSEHSSSDPWTSSRLRDVFKSVVKRLPKTLRILFIIDALDECDDSLSTFLQSIVDVLPVIPSARVKFLLFSRDTSSSSMDGLFEPVGGTMRIIMDENSSHIENVHKYIQSKVDGLCKLRPGLSQLHSEMIMELQKRSVGIYLLASLNLKSLATAVATPANIRSVIQTLPGDLTAIYSKALDKVAPANQPRAAALLLWVVFATRPLRTWELSAAVTITCLDQPPTKDHNFLDEVSLDILGETGIHELVGPLIRVTGGDVVSLVHSSARQYLLDLVPQASEHGWVWGWPKAEWRFDSVAAMASHILLIDCRDVISFALTANISASSPEPITVNSPDAGIRSLLHYAIENLPEHARQCPPGQGTHALFASFLQSADGKTWVQQFWKQKDPTQSYKQFSPLEFCCALGLVEIVKQLLPLDQYPRVNLPDVKAVQRAKADATTLLTAADLAAMFGNVEILRVLCEDMGTPVDSNRLIPQTSWKATPGGDWYHIGRQYGHYDIPDPAPGTKGEDVENEREKAVEQLSWYRPLHTATAYGHAEAAEYLICRGGSISRQDESGKWAIEIAMENKIEDLVRLLHGHHQENIPELVNHLLEVDNPENIERLVQLQPQLMSDGFHFKTILGDYNGSMLHVAAAAGNMSAYKLLHHLGRGHGYKDSEGRQPIHYAAAAGQMEFIKSFLADKVARITDKDTSGRDSLFYVTLGASCCDSENWTPVDKRKQAIQMLAEASNPTVWESSVISSLRLLANFSFGPLWKYRIQNQEATFKDSLRIIISTTPNISLDGDFLRAAFQSTFFPVDIALDLVKNVNETDSRGRTALHIAAAGQREWSIGQARLAKFTDIDHPDDKGMTALRLAVDALEDPEIDEYRKLHRVEVLLQHGADPTCADLHGITPISAPVKFALTGIDHVGCASTIPSPVDGLLSLLLSRCSSTAESVSDEALCHLVPALAVSKRRKDLASLMGSISTRQRTYWLERGLETGPITADVLFACHGLGWPPEALSAIVQHLDGGQVEVAYARAFIEESRIVAETCRAHMKDPNAWLDRGDSRERLINAARRGNKEVVELFVEVMDGNLNAMDTAGQTLLSNAAENGRLELTQYLLSRGADSSIPDAKGKTAVYWAARENKLDALKLLVKAGAPVTENDIAVAKSMNRGAVQAYLESQMKGEAPWSCMPS